MTKKLVSTLMIKIFEQKGFDVFLVLQYWLKRKDTQEKTQGIKHFDIVDTVGIDILTQLT